MCFMFAPVMSSADSGVGGASSTLIPDECETSTVSRTSASAVWNEPTRSATVFALGFMLRITPMSPNGRLPSTSATGFPVSWCSATARFVAIVVRPTPPFGENSVMTLPFSASPPPTVATAPPRAGAVCAYLARSREHRAAEVILLALDAHHDDRRPRDGVRDDLGRGDAVHVGHVDVHEDRVGVPLLGHRDGLLARGRAADHLEVGFEPDELREVLARIRDVVDDEDAYLRGRHDHGSRRILRFARTGGTW